MIGARAYDVVNSQNDVADAELARGRGVLQVCVAHDMSTRCLPHTRRQSSYAYRRERPHVYHLAQLCSRSTHQNGRHVAHLPSMSTRSTFRVRLVRGFCVVLGVDTQK